MANYSLVIGNSFNPFTFQEMLTPYSMYKQEYDTLEKSYEDLSKGADTFKYLSESLPEDSKARQIYEGYANDLSTQADDVLKRGLNMSNRRGLISLKRRYSGEIGRLEQANTAMQKEIDLRRQMSDKDGSMLYATDNLNIDDFLDKKTPNLYSVSGNELYTRGAQAGKSASSRIFNVGDAGNTLGGYYRDWVEKNGYSPESIAAFRDNMSSVPELQAAVDGILAERGVNENLTGASLQRARQAVLNGIMDGVVYQESHKPTRDPGVMDEYQQQSLNLAKDKFEYDKKIEEQDLNSMKQELNLKKQAELNVSKGGDISSTVTPDNLMNNEGFYAGSGEKKKHYSYLGILTGDNRYGTIGTSNGAWGMFGTDNMEDRWGNLSVEGVDDASDLKLLPRDLKMNALDSNPHIVGATKMLLREQGYLTDDDLKVPGIDNIIRSLFKEGYLELVESKNEWPKGNRSNYAIAVSESLTK